MKLLCLSSFPPKSCGIAEFHQCVMRELIAADPTLTFQSIAMNARDDMVDGYPDDVIFQLRKTVWEDYEQAIRLINNSDADVLLVEHEFGLFGGYAGVFGERLLERVTKPVVLVAHTVPIHTDAHKLEHKKHFYHVALNVCKRIIVMHPEAKEWLIKQGLPAEKVSHIDHGAPDMSGAVPIDIHAEYSIPQDHKIAMSFGLFSPGKGIHLTIEAMKIIKEEQVPLTYLIFSEPLRGEENKAYVDSLLEYIKTEQLETNIRLVPGYLQHERLYGLLRSVDFGVLPYKSSSQVSSGVTSYFLAAGKPIVCTRFPYATYICRNGGSIFVPYQNPPKIAKAMKTLVTNPKLYEKKRKEAEAIGDSILWNKKAKEYITALHEAIK